ncbi:AI-2E family transporter [Tannockella kyphosi]|uniref:AI-2E family transporter n=1 Tax=Tannockella kyphosi TaxID=2899121 RepID=UPI002012673D|nr:AI-2E family transporter [Tannockella kyphosi]
MNIDSKLMKKIIFMISYTILFFMALLNLDTVLYYCNTMISVLFPFLLGAAISFILNIPMMSIEKRITNKFKKKSKLVRPLSYFGALGFVLFLMGIVIFIVMPELTATIISLSKTLETFLPQAIEWLESMIENPEIITWLESLQVNWESIIDSVVSITKGSLTNVISSSFEITKTIISGLVNFFIGLIFSCYVLLQKETLCYHLKKIIYAFLDKTKARQVIDILKLTNTTFYHFITGQCLEALILGFMFFVVMIVLQMPYALLVGVLISVTALIPIVGAFIGCFVGAFLILMVNPMQAGLFVIIFLVLQQIEGNIIYPQVVGNSVGLPSIWVLFSVVVGGNLFGVLGMLLFIPINSVLYTLFKKKVNKLLTNKKLVIKK